MAVPSKMVPTFEQAVGAVGLLGILGVLGFLAVQGSPNGHDALVALISLVTGSGIGVMASKALSTPIEEAVQSVQAEANPPPHSQYPN